MKFWKLAPAIIALSLSANINAAVISFDDIETNSYQVLGDSYNSFDWNNGVGEVAAVLDSSRTGSGFDLGVTSGDKAAFNLNGSTPTYIDYLGSGSFNFMGAYFTSGRYAMNLSFEGWANGIQTYTALDVSISASTPMWINLEWNNIDRLIIHNVNGFSWVMDDFTYTSVSSVPVPTALWLFGSGLIGLLGIARRTKT